MSTISNWVEEAGPLLDSLGDGRKAEIRRKTIIHLAEQLAMGRNVASALRGGDPVAEQTYYRWRAEEPQFTAVADKCLDIANRHYHMIGVEAVSRSLNMLRSAAPVVTGELLKLATDPNVDERVRLQAQTEILDRAAVETSSKAPVPSQQVNVGVAQGVNVQNLPLELRRQILAHLEAEQDDE